MIKLGGKKVLITYDDLEEKHLKQIRQVSDKLEVKFVDGDEIPKSEEDSEILYGWPEREQFNSLKNLEWIQVPSAGVDGLLFPELVESDVVLTNTSGMHRTPMSEMSITMILMLAKKMNKFMQSQHRGEWNRGTPEELKGKQAGILGLGEVGMETAWKAYRLGMNVTGLKKSKIKRPSYIDEILEPEDLEHLLGRSDYLVITLPLTDETHHMIGERELKLLGPDSYLINVGRGAVVDNEALLEGLKKDWIAGAGLDVLEKEPLPEDSKFWDLDNVIITPHISGGIQNYQEKATEIFCDNLKSYLKGEKLKNKVNKKAGY